MKVLFKKKEKAVSAVIGTILMVAITVVAGAAVFMYVGGYFTGTPNKPQSLLMDEKNVYSSDFSTLKAVFTVNQGSVGTPFVIKIINQTNGALVASFTVSTWTTSPIQNQLTLTNSGNSKVNKISYTIYDNNNNGKLDTGDSLNIVLSGTTGTAINTSIVDQWAVQISYNGGTIYTYDLNF
ncbi:MAG: archaellin/type IV pilin N-terminal domain-containing protein [Thermoplasmata archaeon]